MKIALTGNPNSGKTTLFNALTGSSSHVGNWAGVTVSKKEAKVKPAFNVSNKDISAIDLPGAYSMSPFSSEETITRDFIKNEKPDVILNIVDATNLSRSLFFTTQLLELNIPVVIALNKSDLTSSKKNIIDIDALSKAFNCPVIETISTKNKGLDKAISVASERVGQSQIAPFKADLDDLSSAELVKASDVKRFDFVKNIVSNIEQKKTNSNQQSKQDLVDKVVANKWLGLPIFAVVMWSVFSISQTHLGPILADILVGWIDVLYATVESLLGNDVSPVLSALLLDGIIAGVGAVVGFLPLIMVLFFVLALLEDCGYMARIAVVMDRYFKHLGLSGKSIIPMIIGTGCAIPGVMATRTIKNERQRRTTAMLTPFMPCGAKLPVIALFAGVFFNDADMGRNIYVLLRHCDYHLWCISSCKNHW
ncbi:ferrous iron transporter B [Psychromonas sp. KJ10-10]|uniref:ferrous iron transporter B n=1 Tax=Psychromonas sp. KJ10-10 TaxID=3391823 RepID=UPI0039B4E4B6